MNKPRLVPVFAMDLPRPSQLRREAGINIESLHLPFGQAITSARKHGYGQILAAAGLGQQPDEYQQHVQEFLRGILDALQLPGEHIGLDIKWTAQGPVIITLRRGEQEKQDEPAPAQTDEPAPVASASTHIPSAGWDIHAD